MDNTCVRYERQGREYPPEAVWQAQEMFCVLRQTYHQIAENTGIAASTLKRWGNEYGWTAKRAEFAQAEADIRADTVLARSAMLKELLASRNPVVGFAVAKLEELALQQARAEREGRMAEIKAAGRRRPINSPAEAAEALQEAVERKLALMLAGPGEVDLKAVQGVRDALALIDSMRPAGRKEKAGARGISRETIEKVEKEILGM